jgi:hypothetical protein
VPTKIAASHSNKVLATDERRIKTDKKTVTHVPPSQAVIHRGQHLAINAGYVEQPWRVTAEGKYEMLGGSTLESIAPFWKR